MRIRKLLATLTTLSLTACGSAESMNQALTPVYPPMGAQSQMQSQSATGMNNQDMAMADLNAPAEVAPTRTLGSATTTPTKTASATTAQSKTATTKSGAAATRTTKATATTQTLEAKLLTKASQALSSIQTATAIADMFEKNAAKGAVRGKIKYYFQAPGRNKMEFIEHSVSAYKGAKLSYSYGAGKVTGRPGGIASFMVMTLPMSDDKVLSRRNYRLDQIDINATIKRLTQPNLGAKVLGKTQIEGREIAIIEYRNTPGHFDKTISRELLGIDMQTGYFRFHEMYQGNEMVYSVRVPQLSVNTALPAKAMDV